MKLSQYVWMPYSDDRDDYRDHVAAAALEEDWGQDKRHLINYVQDNFEIAFTQGKVRTHPQELYCLWRVGTLVTRDGQPITILALKNRLPGKQPYVYTKTFARQRFSVRTSDGKEWPEEAPSAPEYQIPPYRADYKLVYNFDHYLADHEERGRERFPNLSQHQRFLCIWAASELAHKRGGQAAVPQWYCDKNAKEGAYEWLLPLHINSENISAKPDFVATLNPMDEYCEYHVATLLPPEWAYGHARAVSGRDPSFRNWA